MLNQANTDKSVLENILFSCLTSLGYQTTRKAKLIGKSNIEHTFDIMAEVDDDLIDSSLAIHFVDSDIREKQSQIIYNFANDTYDVGIQEKIIVTIPNFNHELIQLAQKWRIGIFNTTQVNDILAAITSKHISTFKNREPIQYNSKQEILTSLAKREYQVKENAKIIGGSGVTYEFDILARISTGFCTYSVGIDFLTNNEEVSLEQIAIFDSKAYDVGITKKVVVANPKLSFNAKLLAKQQHINIFEVNNKGEQHTNVESKEIIKSTKARQNIITEIESNLGIATNYNSNTPILFQADLWYKNYDEMNDLPDKIRYELREAYVNMQLANNLAWFITEIGDSEGKLAISYSNLCTDIASRLTKIMKSISL